MQRETLTNIVKGADTVVRLLATGPYGIVTNTVDVLAGGKDYKSNKEAISKSKNNPFNPPPTQNFTNFNDVN